MPGMRMTIWGRVQGVGFRQAAKVEAMRLALRGWVKNAEDTRRVDVAAWGSAEALAQFAEWLKIGPPGARVERWTMEPVADEPSDTETTFVIRR
jgi:acylphosphatase